MQAQTLSVVGQVTRALSKRVMCSQLNLPCSVDGAAVPNLHISMRVSEQAVMTVVPPAILIAQHSPEPEESTGHLFA